MILVDEELADNGIATLADLAQLVGGGEPTLQLCIQSELIQIEPGRLGSLEDLYGFPINLKDLFMIQPTDIPELLESDKCDIIDAFVAKDALAASPFSVIDAEIGPDQDSLVGEEVVPSLIAPVVREEILIDNPKLEAQIEEAFSILDARVLDTITRFHDAESTETGRCSTARSTG